MFYRRKSRSEDFQAYEALSYERDRGESSSSPTAICRRTSRPAASDCVGVLLLRRKRRRWMILNLATSARSWAWMSPARAGHQSSRISGLIRRAGWAQELATGRRRGHPQRQHSAVLAVSPKSTNTAETGSNVVFDNHSPASSRKPTSRSRSSRAGRPAALYLAGAGIGSRRPLSGLAIPQLGAPPGAA